MNSKLKFLILKLLLLFFFVYFLLSGAIFLLITTIHVNFETTISDDMFVPKFHVTSKIPKFKDKYFSLPKLEKVTVTKQTDGLLLQTKSYIFDFVFKNEQPDSKFKKSISFSMRKKEDINVEELQDGEDDD